MNPESRDRADWFALAGIVVTIGLHLIFQAERPSFAFIAGVSLFWTGFVVVRVWQEPGVFRTWGFRGDNLVWASVLSLAILVGAAGGFAGYALISRGCFRVPAHLPLLLLLYPIWGWIQQFLALGVVIRNLEQIERLRHKTWLVVVIGATLFSLVHPGDIRLIIGTFVLEALIILLYLRWRNLWPLGVLHGWVAALYFLWVLDRDMFVENFGEWM